jgi:NAD(P)-dependent dehydrogenase (short-subunit alcohol dehydrogenase family)
LAVARGLVAEGVHVTAGALKSSAELDELAGTGMVRVVEVDLAEPGGPSRIVAAAGDRVDILVNNDGAAPARTSGFGKITDEDWQASPGAGEESLEDARLVLHPSEPGSGRRGQ